MDYNVDNNPDKEKVIRLVDYLMRIALLRTKIIRDVSEYRSILWLKDIPKQKGCFTQAWGYNEDFGQDVWIEVQNSREPELPSIPSLCKDWIEKASLHNKSDIPALRSDITRQVKNPAWHEESDHPEYISRIELLADYPEVQKAWDQYVEERWLSWAVAHDDWEKVYKVYSKLFAIHQEQLRLGEEYELVLALGLLTWQPPGGQRVRRHLIVADAILEFEARLGKFIVRPSSDGAEVRPELDMLDVQEQPTHAEETAKRSLEKAEDNPWELDCIEETLNALVHSINAKGEYYNKRDFKDIRASDKPIVEYAPALILRKRSVKGLTEVLRQIRERIENGGNIPSEFRDLAEIDLGNCVNQENDVEEINNSFGDEIFFPKPSNEEQRRIVQKLAMANAVLVQGPPGTGKSHTIANLICHLLAKGQRILVTAKTSRALQVLNKHVPEEIRSLCINLLGSGLKEKKSLESSVDGILRKNEEWSEVQADREREFFGQRLRELREEKARIDRRLWRIRESETYSHSIAGGTYKGTAARIAEAVNRNRATYEWFTDVIPLDQACPTCMADLQNMLAAMRRFTPEKRRELNLTWPDNLPSPEEISKLFMREKSAIEEESHSTNGEDGQIVDLLSRTDPTIIREILNSFLILQNKHRQLSTLPHAWVEEALRNVTGGNSHMWRKLHCITLNTIAYIEPVVHIADENSINFLNETNIGTLLDDVCKLKEHMENGGKLGWGPFRPKQVKEHVYVLKSVRLNNRKLSSYEQISTLSDVLRVQVELEKAWSFWKGQCKKTQGPYTLQFHALKALCENLGDVLELENLIAQCHKALQQCQYLGEPIWADESQVQTIISSCRLALARHSKRLVGEEIHIVETSLLPRVRDHTHPITNELLQAVRNRDVDEFTRCIDRIEVLKRERKNIKNLDEDIIKLQSIVPNFMQELEQNYDDPIWETRVQQIQNAWYWAQARTWVEDYIRQEDAPNLAKRAIQIEDEINSMIAKLASLHAWSYCFCRLKDDHRRHMQQWKWHMEKGGKFTGKHAPYHRREAQKHLDGCREAVPAWVMPLHRVWDTVEPKSGMFDVVIVDEASQCGLESLPLFYLGKKILIVGDDKQISPDAVGLPRDPVHRLMEELLHDFRFKSSFDVESSLFDHGKLRHGTKRITLREHFRCMPEIISFSNDLCYSDTPLIPLRQYGSDRLPPLEHIFVSGGYREGSGNSVVNRPEADAVVKKIVELCRDKRYSSKTMGVVILQGAAQAGLIEEKLLDLLGAEEMERRRLICGNPYSFQGDERDIMFLSMVAAPNERIGQFVKPADERRFNVAASRARDQMFLFHSVYTEDLSTACLRRRLLDFFKNTKPQKIAGITREELERRALQDNRSIVKPPDPFDSWFEIDVALELMRKKFKVIPQYEVAGKKIDLVIEEGNMCLAVECDGDEWHGSDRYEEDMQRQRQLERCDWNFVRIRESAFYSNKEGALQELWRALEERGVIPGTSQSEEKAEIDINEKDNDGYDFEEVEVDGEVKDLVLPSADSFECESKHSGERVDEETISKIQNLEIEYVLDKETKGACRFKPKDDTIIGNATIYLPKDILKENGIDPEKGFDIIIRPK